MCALSRTKGSNNSRGLDYMTVQARISSRQDGVEAVVRALVSSGCVASGSSAECGVNSGELVAELELDALAMVNVILGECGKPPLKTLPKPDPVAFDGALLWCYAVLADDTSVLFEETAEDGTVSIVAERPSGDGFDRAECSLPLCRWKNVAGFDEGEIAELTEFVRNNAPLLYEMADEKSERGKWGVS